MIGLMTILLVGLMMCISVLIMLGRLGIRKFLGYPNLFDILFAVLMIVVFHGTYTGMVAAGFASLFMSGVLVLLRSTIGAERLAFEYRGSGKWYNPGTCRVFWQRLRPSEL